MAVIDPDRPRERAAEEAELRRPDPQVAAEALEPEAGLLADSDPIGFAGATMELAAGLARRPLAAGYAAVRLGADLGLSGAATWMRALGLDASGRIAAGPRDRRFKDPAWERYPWWFGVQQAYLLWSRSMLELVEAAGLDGPDKMKAEFAVRVCVDALAPTNFLAGNPTALRRAAETNGRSVLAGMQNMAGDLLRNGGRPRQVDTVAVHRRQEPGRHPAARSSSATS